MYPGRGWDSICLLLGALVKWLCQAEPTASVQFLWNYQDIMLRCLLSRTGVIVVDNQVNPEIPVISSYETESHSNWPRYSAQIKKVDKSSAAPKPLVRE